MPNAKYDLESRTSVFSESILNFIKQIPRNPLNENILRQLIRSATSIGANYCEADCAETKKDFIHKLGICNKESKETKYWLRMLRILHRELSIDIDRLQQESHELQLIFITIIKKSRENI